MTDTPTPTPALAPASPHDEQLELTPSALGIEGNRLLGRVEATTGCARQVLEWSRQTIDLAERRTLLNVARALQDRAEHLKAELATFAVKRGAGKIVQPKPGILQ